jgi:hypothetical protein
LWYELTYLERIVSTAVRTSLLLRRYLLQTLLSTAILILVFHSTSRQTPGYYLKTDHTYILIHNRPTTSHSMLNLSSLFSVLKLFRDKPNNTWILTTSESITHMNIPFNNILQNTFYSGYSILTVLVQLSTKDRRYETFVQIFVT